MIDIVEEAVACVRRKRVDESFLQAFTEEMQRSVESSFYAMQKLSETIGLSSTLFDSESESESSSSSGSSSEEYLSAPSYETLKTMDLIDEECIAFFKLGLALLEAIRTMDFPNRRQARSVITAWGSLALDQSGKSTCSELLSSLERFLTSACLFLSELQISDAFDYANGLVQQLVDAVLHQFSQSFSIDELSVELLALQAVAKVKPMIFYYALEASLKRNSRLDPIPLLHRYLCVCAILGQILPKYDMQAFLSSTLWSFMLDLAKSSEGMAFATVSLWFLSLLLPLACRDMLPYEQDVLLILRQAVLICSEERQIDSQGKSSSQELPERVVPFASKLASHLPLLNVEQIQSSFAHFLSHLSPSSQSLGRFRLPPISPSANFDDNPPDGCRIQQVELWMGPTSATSGDHAIRAMRLTVQNGFGVVTSLGLHGDTHVHMDAFATKHVLTLDPNECIVRIDVSFYDIQSPGTSKLPSRHQTFIGALQFTTTKRIFPWIGTPSRQTHLDVSIQSRRYSEEARDNLEGTTPAFHSVERAQDTGDCQDNEIIGLFGSFEDGMLRSLGATFIATSHTQLTIVHSLQGLLSFCFRSMYAISPWNCLRFFHDEQAGMNPSIVQALFLQIRLHPGLIHEDGINRQNFHAYVEWLSLHASTNDKNSPSEVQWIHPLTSRAQEHAADDLRSTLHRLQAEIQLMGEWQPKEWAIQRDLTAEKEISSNLHKRLHAQREQVKAFEKERKKWDGKVQLRLDKYASDRKLLSEQNMELQSQLRTLETKLEKMEKDLHKQTAYGMHLEGVIQNQASSIQEANNMNEKCRVIETKLSQWDAFHITEIARVEQRYEQEIQDLKRRWSNALEKAAHDKRTEKTPPLSDTNDDYRVIELEKTLKQKDHALQSLKTMLERHQGIAEAKLKQATSKYEHAKAINIALQVGELHAGSILMVHTPAASYRWIIAEIVTRKHLILSPACTKSVFVYDKR
ncbi:hypothetical protein AC1031_017182 [Aphanomyces cochlioides]|nr:hypothetical protein AC1031_017182 [Aphanomyces cochlioides]